MTLPKFEFCEIAANPNGWGPLGSPPALDTSIPFQQYNKDRLPSVQVRPDWRVIEEMDFPRLLKLSLPGVGSGEDINKHQYGTLHFYDKAIDRVSVRTPITLQRCGGNFYNVTTTEDPVIEELAQQGIGNVFATDIILATLMTAPRSVSSVKLDGQKGAVLATEIKNNSCKLAKWTVQALLANSDAIKFGYVSRMSVRNSAQHVILGTQQLRPVEFAQNISMNMDNGWGILRCVIDSCMRQPQGKYLLMKDPQSPVVRLYSLPEGTFESDQESNDEQGGDSDDDN
ncbi:eukaryotic translation initiation factor 3 subunit 7 [Necator americanus]|uniref:Eukaryotic translation initiation factor 3 subunit p66 n=1 Tax=Necator americanus TaxID=51031 RepID=W2TMP3_NECAM|nr:eukaryotic translation initiation factor 3 subunit 7 [Necator americanus]ETN83370.1 eukaryotic translation initiation factor 3 subunit 7 [Necator americanus]